jgi:hypothetical protein
MNPRILAPIRKVMSVIGAFWLYTISGELLITQAGENLRAIQDA